MSEELSGGVSVVICTWNRAALLKDTLQSLNSLSIAPECNIEVLVIDNNSVDETRSIVMAMVSVWRVGDIRYIFEPRQGKQYALNTAIAESSYDILAFTDDDVLFDIKWIDKIVALFADKKIDLAGGRTVVDWGAISRPVWFHDQMSAILAGVDFGEELVVPAPQEYVPGGTNLIARKKLFYKVGNFSESHYRHMDYEFGVRCHRNHAVVAYDPTVIVYAPVDQSCVSRRYFRRWSFKAGVSGGDAIDGSTKLILGVPRWIYKRLFFDLMVVMLRRHNLTEAERFLVELRVWRYVGYIAGKWHLALFPGNHEEWVVRFSQKKNNIY